MAKYKVDDRVKVVNEKSAFLGYEGVVGEVGSTGRPHVDLEPNLDVDDPEEGWQDVPFAESELKKVVA
jgi:hypothetical protein